MMIPIGCAVIAFFVLGVLGVYQLSRIGSNIERLRDIVNTARLDIYAFERQREQSSRDVE